MRRHNCSKQVRRYGWCRPCKQKEDLEREGPREGPRRSLAEVGAEYIRAKLKEASFARQILPPKPIRTLEQIIADYVKRKFGDEVNVEEAMPLLYIEQERPIERIQSIGSSECIMIPGRTTVRINGEIVE